MSAWHLACQCVSNYVDGKKLLYYELNDKSDKGCYDVLQKKKGQQVRKGKAMKQRHNDNFITIFANTFRPNDDHGIIMHAADKAEWFIKCCLKKAGLSGYLGPGVSICSLE